jgi:hypothetical protein
MKINRILLDDGEGVDNSGGPGLTNTSRTSVVNPQATNVSLSGEEQEVTSGDVANDVFEGDSVFELEPSKKKDKLVEVKDEKTGEKKTVGVKVEKQEEVLEEKSDEEEETVVEDKKEVSKEKEEAEHKDSKNRNYDGISAEDAAFLKKQPNRVFEAVAPIAREKASLAAKVAELTGKVEQFQKDPNRVPDNWYENEQAFQLTPEYKQINTQYSRWETEGSHWQRQLAKINAGADTWQNLGWSKERGYFLTDPAQVPTDMDKRADLVAQMTQAKDKASFEMNSLQTKVGVLQNTFKERYDGYKTYYDEPIKERFGALPKELQPTKEHEDLYKSFVHPLDADKPQTALAAKMFSVLVNQGKVINFLRGQQTTKKMIADDAKAAGPQNRTSQNGGSSSGNRPLIKNGKIDKSATLDFEELTKELEDNNN